MKKNMLMTALTVAAILLAGCANEVIPDGGFGVNGFKDGGRKIQGGGY